MPFWTYLSQSIVICICNNLIHPSMSNQLIIQSRLIGPHRRCHIHCGLFIHKIEYRTSKLIPFHFWTNLPHVNTIEYTIKGNVHFIERFEIWMKLLKCILYSNVILLLCLYKHKKSIKTNHFMFFKARIYSKNSIKLLLTIQICSNIQAFLLFAAVPPNFIQYNI